MRTQITSIGAVALLVLTACGGGDSDTESAPEPAEATEGTQEATEGPEIPDGVDEIEAAEIEAQWEEDQREDPWENIPDDAPIHDMDEEDIARAFLDCEDDETLEECEDRYDAEMDASHVEMELERCEMTVRTHHTGMPCESSVMPNEDFYELYEDRMGETVPDELRAED